MKLDRVLKWIKRYHFMLNILIIVVGIVLVIIKIPQNDQINNTLMNVGCSIIASGIVALFVYPNLETDTQVAYQRQHEEIGLLAVYSIGTLIFEDSESPRKKLPKKHIDIITDRIEDLNDILSNQNSFSKKIQIRILTRQPTQADNTYAVKNQLLKIAKEDSRICIKFYDRSLLPPICRRDGDVVLKSGFDYSSNWNGVYYRYNYYSDIGQNVSNYFENIWSGSSDQISSQYLISKSSLGRANITQKGAVEAILKHFCNKGKIDLGIKSEIEAVVVIWTSSKKLRRTFYSCNKQPGAPSNNMRSYDFGVVGMLQAQIEESKASGHESNDCILLYDKDDSPEECQYVIDWRNPEQTQKKKVQRQEWTTKSTKAMLAISLFRIEKGRPEMYGALTFDFAESLKDKTEEQKKHLFSTAYDCRNLVLHLLGTTVYSDYEEQLILLEEAEAKIQ